MNTRVKSACFSYPRAINSNNLGAMSALPLLRERMNQMSKYWIVTVLALSLCGCATVGGLKSARIPGVAGTVIEHKAPVVDTNTVRSVSHIAVGCKVSASSTSQEWAGEGPASAVVDGNLNTRWSSLFADAQWITMDLGKEANLKGIRLHWEAAAAMEYTVSVSGDGSTWKKVASHEGQMASSRIDTVGLAGISTRHLKVDLLKRVNPEWGYSLYEIEVIGE